MAKNKSGQTKPKKLRLVNNSLIGLNDAQQRELSDLFKPLARIGNSSVSSRNMKELRSISSDRLLYIYIEALCHDARVENSSSRARRTTAMRRSVLKQLGKLCGREFSPDDLIKRLASHSPVPRFAADAIWRDYLRLTV
jgi:hypothetical protein